eukprot:403348287
MAQRGPQDAYNRDRSLIWVQRGSTEYQLFLSRLEDNKAEEYMRKVYYCQKCWSFLTQNEANYHKEHNQWIISPHQIKDEKSFLQLALENGKLDGNQIAIMHSTFSRINDVEYSDDFNVTKFEIEKQNVIQQRKQNQYHRLVEQQQKEYNQYYSDSNRSSKARDFANDLDQLLNNLTQPSVTLHGQEKKKQQPHILSYHDEGSDDLCMNVPEVNSSMHQPQMMNPFSFSYKNPVQYQIPEIIQPPVMYLNQHGDYEQIFPYKPKEQKKPRITKPISPLQLKNDEVQNQPSFTVGEMPPFNPSGQGGPFLLYEQEQKLEKQLGDAHADDVLFQSYRVENLMQQTRNMHEIVNMIFEIEYNGKTVTQAEMDFMKKRNQEIFKQKQKKQQETEKVPYITKQNNVFKNTQVEQQQFMNEEEYMLREQFHEQLYQNQAIN